MKHTHKRTPEQQAALKARHEQFHAVPATWCPACRAIATPGRQHPSLRSHIPPRGFECPECARVFDLTDEEEAMDLAYGHDCEVKG